MGRPEDGLVKRARAGDAVALEGLISSYEKRVYRFIYRTVGNVDDAADLTQETFLRVCACIKYFRGDSSFASWIYRIASNVCVDRLRRARRQTTLSLDAPVTLEDGECAPVLKDDSPGPGDLAESADLKAFVLEGIRELPPDYRQVVILHDLHGLQYREIADIAGCPIGTVKSRLNRARLALKERLYGKGAEYYLTDSPVAGRRTSGSPLPVQTA